MRVRVDIVVDDKGDTLAICRRCDEEARCPGTGPEVIRRCLDKLRGDCPMGETNNYKPFEVKE